MACYVPRWYTRPKTVTHPGTNRARRALTSFMRRTPLTTTPRANQDACKHEYYLQQSSQIVATAAAAASASVGKTARAANEQSTDVCLQTRRLDETSPRSAVPLTQTLSTEILRFCMLKCPAHSGARFNSAARRPSVRPSVLKRCILGLLFYQEIRQSKIVSFPTSPK